MSKPFVLKTVACFVTVIVLITLFVLKESQKSCKVGSTVEFLLPLENSDFLIGTTSDVGVFNIEDGSYEMLPSAIEIDRVKPPIYDGRSIEKGDIYITSHGYLWLLNSSLKMIRQDFYDGQLNHGDFAITPNGDVAAFSNSNPATFSWGTEITIVNLISGMTLKKLDNDSIPIFIYQNENQSLITAQYSKDKFSHLVEREIGNWEPKSHLELRVGATCMAQELKDKKLIVGTETGVLFLCDISPLSLKLKIEVSPHKITAICPLNNRSIAVGDSNGNVYIVDVVTKKKYKLPESVRCQFVTCLAYSSVSKTLIAGFWTSRVQYWKLNNIESS